MRPKIPIVPEILTNLLILMERCWSDSPDERPSFVEIFETLKDISKQLDENSENKM